MDTANKLQRIIDTKADIKQAIEAKGRDLTGKTFETDYAAEIALIETGNGNGAPLEITGQQVLTGIVDGPSNAVINENSTVLAAQVFKHVQPLADNAVTGQPTTGGANNGSWTPDENFFAVGQSNNPFLSIYERSGDTFSKINDPDIIPANQVRKAQFSSDGTYLACAHDNSPFLTIYKKNGSTFNKLANPGDLPTVAGFDVSFDSSGTYLAVSFNGGDSLIIYKRDGDVFNKLSEPDILPENRSGRSVAFSPNGEYLAVTSALGNRFFVYKRNGDNFTSLTVPAFDKFQPMQASLNWDPDSNYVAFSASTSGPAFAMYKRTGDTFVEITAGSSSSPTFENPNPLIFPFNSGGFTNNFFTKVNNEIYFGAVGTTILQGILMYNINTATDEIVFLGDLDKDIFRPVIDPRACFISPNNNYVISTSSTPGKRVLVYKMDPNEDWKEVNIFVVNSYPNNNVSIAGNTTRWNSSVSFRQRDIKYFGYAKETKNKNEAIEFVSIFRRITV